MAALAIFTLWLALARRVLQPFEHVGLGDILGVRISREGVTVETMAEERTQAVLVSEEPCFHALDHEMCVFVRCAEGLVPVVAPLEVYPRTRILGDRTLAVDEQYDEVIVVGGAKCVTEIPISLLPAATGEHPG